MCACVCVVVIQVVRNVVFEPRLLPGGGATEMAVSQALSKKAQVHDDAFSFAFRLINDTAVKETCRIIRRCV